MAMVYYGMSLIKQRLSDKRFLPIICLNAAVKQVDLLAKGNLPNFLQVHRNKTLKTFVSFSAFISEELKNQLINKL